MKYFLATFVLLFISLIYIVSVDNYSVLEISKERMDTMCDEEYECYGYATWGETEEGKYCTIFMLPDEYYPTFADYEYVLDHEKRHCEEGAFH